tara:strand:- start:1473 stop:2339 length:867 start_codon:yes stop_codon:yes gene_type:complete
MNLENNIIDVNETDFTESVINKSQDKLVIVDFWAPWCGPCKQLTPMLEKIINSTKGKVLLAKINIDENQQIAAQLRIQSIPTVYAFKDKQIVNAFQGVIPENKIIEFIEKSLGSKINENQENFYKKISHDIEEGKIEESKEVLLEFISDNPKEIKAIGLYINCLIELKQYAEADEFIKSLEVELLNKGEIKQIIKKLEIINKNLSGPSIEELLQSLKNKPKNISLILEISDKYFSQQEYEEALSLLLENYPKNKEIVRKKIIEFFSVLGDTNTITIEYRKKLSQMMFS